MVACFIIYQVIMMLSGISGFIYKHFLTIPLNLYSRYGADSWVCITGSSSGQGRQFALKFAEKGFNIVLIGSKRIKSVEKEIQEKSGVKVISIVKNFCDAYKDDFFDDIIEVFDKIDLSVLINNVGHRTAWIPYHEMPKEYIRNTIMVGTMVQCRLIQLVIPKFLQRNKDKGVKSAIVNMTAQCMHTNIGFGMSNEISVPYMSVYEATNAFGFYHSNSVYQEYKHHKSLDFLTITPGAIVTENTQYLSDTIFSISADKYVDNILRLMGNVNGIHNAHYGHSLSTVLINFAPFTKDKILKKVGYNIANNIMENTARLDYSV